MKKLSYEEVKEDFNSIDFTLLDTVYSGSYVPLKCSCNTCGTVFYKKPSYVRQGDGCIICAGLTKQPFSYVREYIAKRGYKLLSSEADYINNRSILLIECDRFHTYHAPWNRVHNGSICPICRYINQGINQTGDNNPQWKGGVKRLKVPLYTTYAPQLEKYQPVYKIEQNGLELLGVECMYCDQVFVPTIKEVESRLGSIASTNYGDRYLYCSENCKKACPTYGQHKYPKGFKISTSREVQPQLRKLVLARDNYQCQICGVGIEEAELHCHHIEPVSQNPIESADMNNCVTLCKEHHKQVHTLPGCGYNELKCDR